VRETIIKTLICTYNFILLDYLILWFHVIELFSVVIMFIDS